MANYPAEGDDLAAMLHIAREKDDLPGQVEALNRQVQLAAESGELETGKKLAEEALELALSSGDRKLEAGSRYVQV
jgi:hypothetical protein